MKYLQPKFTVYPSRSSDYRDKYDHSMGKCNDDCEFCKEDRERDEDDAS